MAIPSHRNAINAGNLTIWHYSAKRHRDVVVHEGREKAGPSNVNINLIPCPACGDRHTVWDHNYGESTSATGKPRGKPIPSEQPSSR